MNRLFFAGLIVAILSVGAYVIVAVRNKNKPELADGIVVFIGAVSVFGALRLVGCALTGQFSKLASLNYDYSLWSLSSEDAVFVVIGGIALAWVSVQTMWESFAKVRKSARNTSTNQTVSGNPVPGSDTAVRDSTRRPDETLKSRRGP
jgi:hypothetical protein